MSRGSGSSVIPIAVFIAILLIVLPAGADNVTITETTVAISQTTATPMQTTDTVTQPTTVVTTANPTMSVKDTETTGSVMIYSSPTGATILIDGISSGTTPKTVNAVAAGNHFLRLELSGYYDYEGSIYVVPGQLAQGYGTLQPMNQVTSAMPTPVPAATIPVIVPVVTATPEPTQDMGLLGNTTVLVAIIGAITVLIATGVSVFIHLTPPKKE